MKNHWKPAVATLALLLAGALAEAAPIASREPGAGLLFYAKGEYAYNQEAISNPYIVGGFFQIIWSEVEKAEGECDWSEVDKWIEPWIQAGKKVALRIMWSTSGYWNFDYYKHPTPRWVWEKGTRHAYHEPSQTEIPLIWDPIYMEYAARFMKQVDAKYGVNPDVLFIDVTPGAETNPYRFGTINRRNPEFKDEFLRTAASDGRTYSEELWMDTLKEWIQLTRSSFGDCPLLVTLNIGGLNVDDRSAEVGEFCVANGLHVGQNGLGKSSYLTDSARRRAFAAWEPRTKFFFEMVAGSGGRTGTLMEVMEAAKRIRCSYLNVYPEDVLRGTPGNRAYQREYEDALRYGAEIIGSPILISSGTDISEGRKVFTYEQRDDILKLERLRAESKLGPERRGRFTHYFEADTDGSIQPVGMYVPEDYNHAESYPLVVQLHGIGPKFIAGVRADWPGMRDQEWINPDLGVIYAQAYARQNASYEGIAESEVLQIIQLARESYNIDPDRIYIMGHSMGGGGTLKIGLHHPHLFAAMVPIDSAIGGGRSGDAEGADWLKPQTATTEVMAHAANAHNLPVLMHAAGRGAGSAQEALYEAMKAEGGAPHAFTIHEGMPHHFAEQIPYHTFIPEMLKHRRETAPKSVKFRSNTLKYGQAYWAHIESFEKQGEFASLDAQWTDARLSIRSENIDRLRLDLSGAPSGAFIEIGGAAIQAPPGGSEATLVLEDGEWRLSDQPLPDGVKRPGMQGPIGDAFSGRFLLVYGDDADFQLAHAEVDAIRNPPGARNCIAGDFPFKAWSEVTEADVRDHNLILFGNAYTNPLIAEINDELPIRISDQSVRYGIEELPGGAAVFIAPNPKNPARYVVVWSGPVFSRSDAFSELGGRTSIQSLPDYLIFDGANVVKAGLFDEDWEF